MPLGPKGNGETVNATVSISPTTFQYSYAFNDPYDLLINLNNAEDMLVTGGNNNDKYNLMNAGYLTINAGNGNDIFAVSAKTGSLNGNIIRAGGGYDFITLLGSDIDIDLTEGATGVEAVVGRGFADGQSVTVDLGKLSSSALTNGGTGRAFAAVIGSTGEVNVLMPGSFHLTGIVDAAGNGFDGTGAAITGTALASLKASVTQISAISGNLAALYAGTVNGNVPSKEQHIAEELHAYVFTSGNKSYTIWSDGIVTPTDKDGNVLDPVYQPAPVTPAAPPSYGIVPTFDADEAGHASVALDVNGIPKLILDSGTTNAYTAINLALWVSDSTVRGDSRANGLSWFGLGLSGGYNHIIGSAGGNVFDLQTSTYLQDRLTGGKGFDVVRAAADGADVDLTVDGGTGFVAASIEAVVGSANANNVQSVELSVNNLKFTNDATGAKVGIFEALLGSAEDVLNLSGTGKWVEAAVFAPGDPLPDHALPILHAEILNSVMGVQSASAHSAENALIGHLFAQVNGKGEAIKYLTVYTDATIESSLAEGVLVV
jgi:hypothetical protein